VSYIAKDLTMTSRKISKLRRKLLIASAATPVVATLHSGAALAASSGVCKPISGEVSNKKFPGNGNSLYGDTAVRYSVPTYEKNHASGQKKSRYIYEIDGQLYHHSGHIFSGDLGNYTQLPENEQAQVLMLYSTDDDGTYEVGLWPKFQVNINIGGGQFPIHLSCLTSIAVSGFGSFRGL